VTAGLSARSLHDDSEVAPYRREVDGLRAVAVLAVIINHLNKNILPAGYLGVDVFFVISGYVITSSLAHRPNRGFREFLATFYARRVKRLIPALTLCVAVSGVLICLFDPDPVFSMRTGIASLFGLSNVYLLKQATDYFGSSTELNIFTHTWSLAVEEQFYLLFPTLVWLSGFGRQSKTGARNLTCLTSVFSVASLVAFVYLYRISQSAAYFLMPTRLWELGAGCVMYPGAKTSIATGVVRRFSPSKWAAALIALFFLPSYFAVAATIAVVVVTAVLLATLRPATLAYTVLTSPQAVYIGLISYSLYLWHWVVLTLAHWTIGMQWWSVSLQIAVIFGLASASYRYVENPLRRSRWFPSAPKSIACGIGASLVTAMLLIVLSSRGNPLYAGSRPGSRQNSSAVIVEPTTPGSIHGNLILIGDSHAGHFEGLARTVAHELNLRSVVISELATPYPGARISLPFGGLSLRTSETNNAQMAKDLQDLLTRPGRGNLILLSSFYELYFGSPAGSKKHQQVDHYLDDGREVSQRESFDHWLEDLAAFARFYSEARIVVFLSTPEMPDIYPEAPCQREWFRPAIPGECHVQVSRNQLLAELEGLNRRISATCSELANVLVFDPLPSLCPAGNEFCSSDDGGGRLFADEDHLTPHGSQMVTNQFLSFLKDRNAANFLSAPKN
jgi:peptidoglycan/LPS O-acetylase OafA/YrhL